MDSRARERLRNWRESGAPEDQARAIQEAIRYSSLDPKLIQLCAFLGHPASRLVADGVKNTGLVVKNKLLKNEEMSELARGLTFFGLPAAHRINLSLVRMAFATREKISRNSFTYKNAMLRTWVGFLSIEKYSTGLLGEESTNGISVHRWFNTAMQAINGDKQAAKILSSLSRDLNNQIPAFDARWTRSRPLPDVVLNLAHESFLEKRPRPKTLKFCNGYYDDVTILKYIRQEIYPWALGEFYEGPQTPCDFIAHPPYISARTGTPRA